MALILHTLRKGDLFVDVGANVGAYALLASGICGARTVAIEPVPSTFRNLVLNVQINGLTDLVSCQNIGVWSHATHLRFTDGLDVLNRVVLDDAGEDVETIIVEVKPLDEVLQDEIPVLLKVDVEGCEYQVLQGAQRMLNDESLCGIIVEVQEGNYKRYGHTVKEVKELLEAHGFAPCVYNPFERSFVMESKVGRPGFNEIYIRDLEFLVQRVREAP